MVSSRRSPKPDADKLFVLADKKWSQGRLQAAFRLFLAAAKAGDRAAQTNIGYFMSWGSVHDVIRCRLLTGERTDVGTHLLQASLQQSGGTSTSHNEL